MATSYSIIQIFFCIQKTMTKSNFVFFVNVKFFHLKTASKSSYQFLLEDITEKKIETFIEPIS